MLLRVNLLLIIGFCTIFDVVQQMSRELFPLMNIILIFQHNDMHGIYYTCGYIRINNQPLTFLLFLCFSFILFWLQFILSLLMNDVKTQWQSFFSHVSPGIPQTTDGSRPAHTKHQEDPTDILPCQGDHAVPLHVSYCTGITCCWMGHQWENWRLICRLG